MCAIDKETLSKISGAMDDLKEKAVYKCPVCGQSSFFDDKDPEKKNKCPHCGFVWCGTVN